ncbi:MAG TPA: DUF2760 domain-containing protein [Vicinamibacterales bacterium]|nr:DUF2760 domain-containing protein [Vicinamibacterales bacterium]
MISYGRRLRFAFRTFFSILDHHRIPDDVAEALQGERPKTTVSGPPVEIAPVSPQPPVADEPHRAVQLLALLQRDGRLVDFLMEDLAAYQDAQIGAAVRDVHAGARQVLQRYFTLEPVIDDEEGRPVTVPAGFDPAGIRVVGAVIGTPPFHGVLRHHGWQATRVELPPLAAGRTVVAPAEVELP